MEVCLDSELGFLQGKAQISMAVLVGTDEMKLNNGTKVLWKCFLLLTFYFSK